MRLMQPDDTCALVKTLERPTELDRLLESIRRYFPELPVIVADDARDHTAAAGIAQAWGAAFLPLEHDVGLSAGRNALLDTCTLPYFVMLDDDFVFTELTAIHSLVDPIRRDLCDLTGGSVLHHGQETHFEGFMALDAGGTLRYTKVNTIGPARVDITYNFLGGRTEPVRAVRWDDELKVCEHQAFFLRVQRAGLRVWYIPGVMIDHRPGNNKIYSPYRKTRSRQYWDLFAERYGVRQVAGSLA